MDARVSENKPAQDNPAFGSAGPASGSAGENQATTGKQEIGDTLEQAKSVARNVGEQARTMLSGAGSTAQDLARRAREQAGVATDTLYEQGGRAGEYLMRNVNEYPLAALFVAGAVGYGLAYLIHTSWQSQGDTEDGNGRRSERKADRDRRD